MALYHWLKLVSLILMLPMVVFSTMLAGKLFRVYPDSLSNTVSQGSVKDSWSEIDCASVCSDDPNCCTYSFDSTDGSCETSRGLVRDIGLPRSLMIDRMWIDGRRRNNSILVGDYVHWDGTPMTYLTPDHGLQAPADHVACIDKNFKGNGGLNPDGYEFVDRPDNSLYNFIYQIGHMF